MTPAEFYAKMQEIQASPDSAESKHARMDALMCDLLQSLGYTDGVQVFQKTQ